MIVRPFEMYHLDLIRAQGVQGAQLRDISLVPQTSGMVQPNGPAVTAFDGDQVILCGGIARQFQGHGQCWALLSANAGRHMTFLHRAVLRFITMESWQRLEATVEEDFIAGCRWAELLGFEFEGKMPKYGMHGETHIRYARYG